MSNENQDQSRVDPNHLKTDLLQIMNQIKEPRLPQRAYHIIRFAIRNLKLFPGQTVLEREMADALEMSRTPVREALVRLQTEGKVKMVPRRGFIVEPIEKKDLKEIYEIVESLDGLAVELATNKITENELEYLEQLINQQKDSLRLNDLNKWASLDDQFHGEIINYAHSTRLNDVIAIHADQLYRARLYTINDRPVPYRSITEHQALIACMEAQDGKAARLVMQSHRQRARSEILKALENDGF